MISTDSCWLFASGGFGGRGHGQISVDGAKFQAHRVVYEDEVGPIPEGLELDHLCENPPCINPSHLEPVTHRENTLRYYRNRTHCRRGHPYAEFGYTKFKKSNVSESNPTGESRCCRECTGQSYQRLFKANPEKMRKYWRQQKARLKLSTEKG